jgi:hypothetical protein
MASPRSRVGVFRGVRTGARIRDENVLRIGHIASVESTAATVRLTDILFLARLP